MTRPPRRGGTLRFVVLAALALGVAYLAATRYRGMLEAAISQVGE